MSQHVIIREHKSCSVELNPSVAQKINDIAARRRMQVALLVNEILEQYLASRPVAPKSDSAAFLLSLGGMFQSGTSDTSENVHAIVSDFLKDSKRGKP